MSTLCSKLILGHIFKLLFSSQDFVDEQLYNLGSLSYP